MKNKNQASVLERSNVVDILLVEDNEDDFVIVREFLPATEFAITWCVSAGAARDKLAQREFDVALLDHGLPDTNSLAFLEEVHGQYPQLPVIILTGYENQALAVSALKKGATSYLLKEEIAQHLLPAVSGALGRSGARAEATATTASSRSTRFVDTAERVYRVLLETMNEGCFVVAADGIISFVNEAIGHLIGQNANHLPGRYALDIFAPETGQRLQQILVEAAAVQVPQRNAFEGKVRGARGREVPVLVSTNSMHTNDGRYEGTLIVLSDVSELAQARQKLDRLYHKERERNRKLQTLYKISTAASELHPDSLMAHACRLISQEFGYYRVSLGQVNDHRIRIEQQHQVLRGCPLDASKPAEVINRRLNNVMTAAVNEQRFIYVPDIDQSPYDLPESGERTYSELAVPILSQEGPIGVLDVQSDQVDGLTQDDILILKLMADRLAKALENAKLFQTIINERGRLQALIESSYDGILFFTPDLRILVINSRMIELARLPGELEEWINRPMQAVLDVLAREIPSVLPTALTELSRIQAGEQTPGQGENEMPPYTIQWHTIPVSVGAVSLGWLLVLRDVTSERLVETMRQDLTRTMVHDLRNPLTAILGSLDLMDRLDQMNEAELSPHQRKFLDRATFNTQKMITLVNSILEISQLEGGQIPLQMRQIVISELVSEAVRAQAALVTGKLKLLENEVSPTLPPVWGDWELIGRVLQNLLDNAIKYSSAGGRIQIRAWLSRDEDLAQAENLFNASPHIYISISDTGPGIPLDLQRRLFQKFVTGDQSERGNGLGLAFCKLVVEAHSGRIWVESEPGQGTTFTFTLPVASGVEMS